MNNLKFNIVIPARYASSRFPGKPLALIEGEPMLWHVYQRALEAAANEIIIATDDERIRDTAAAFGADVCMTRPDCESGTDRIAEVCQKKGWSEDSVVVNLQGDEPLTPPEIIKQVAENLSQNPDASMATLSSQIGSLDDFRNPNIVKVVTDHQGYALYFSRASIPHPRDQLDQVPESAARHIGIYAYRVAFLKVWPKQQPSALEQIEKLEQLRAMHNGARIHVATAERVPLHGVDTPDQLRELERVIRQSSK